MVENEELGTARPQPVSEERPLSECKHFVVGHLSTAALPGEALGIRGFYAARDVLVIATVVDGDRGLDVACMMLGLPRSSHNRTALRNELADYLCERAEEPWMQDILVATQELDSDVVQASWEESGPPPIPPEPSLAIREPAPPSVGRSRGR